MPSGDSPLSLPLLPLPSSLKLFVCVCVCAAVQGGFYQSQTGGSQQQPTSVAYYGYQQQQQQQQYRPPQQQATPQQSGYYYQQHTPSATQAAAAAVKTTPTATPTVAHQGVGYGTSMAVAAALPAVAYPSSYSSPHYSSTAATSRCVRVFIYVQYVHYIRMCICMFVFVCMHACVYLRTVRMNGVCV